MPVQDTLLDIASHLGAQSVRLPTHDEIQQYNRGQETKVQGEQNATGPSVGPVATTSSIFEESSQNRSISSSHGKISSGHTPKSSSRATYAWIEDERGRLQQYEVVPVERWLCAWCQMEGPWSLVLDSHCPNCHRQRDAYSTIITDKEYRSVSGQLHTTQDVGGASHVQGF